RSLGGAGNPNVILAVPWADEKLGPNPATPPQGRAIQTRWNPPPTCVGWDAQAQTPIFGCVGCLLRSTPLYAAAQPPCEGEDTPSRRRLRRLRRHGSRAAGAPQISAFQGALRAARRLRRDRRDGRGRLPARAGGGNRPSRRPPAARGRVFGSQARPARAYL